MTESEGEVEKRGGKDWEIYKIKRAIKVSFKRESKPPETDLKQNYKFGRILGRGTFGKVNLALHMLTRKVVAVKSINKMKIQRE